MLSLSNTLLGLGSALETECFDLGSPPELIHCVLRPIRGVAP